MMKRLTENEREILLTIAEAAEDCSDVTITLDEIGITIREAPAKVLEDVLKDGNILSYSLDTAGLHIAARP